MRIFDMGLVDADGAGQRKPGPRSRDDQRSLIDELVQGAKNEAQSARKDWKTHRDFFIGEGQAWEFAAPGLPEWLQGDWSVTNHTKAAVQNVVSIVQGALPVWYVVSADDQNEQDDAAQRTTSFLRAWEQFINYSRHERQAIENAFVVGTGVLKRYWDAHRRKNGDVVVRSIQPELIFPDPTATSLEDCSFLAIRNVYGLEAAWRKWPELDIEKAKTTVSEDALNDLVITQDTDATDRVEVWEVYYDFGERLMIYSGEQTFFDDVTPVPESEVLPHRYPVHLYEYHAREDQFWADGLVAELVDPQNRVNRGNTRMSTWQRYMAAPIWTTEDQGVKDSFDMTPGTINYTPPESNTQPHRPPSLPPDVAQAIEMAKNELDTLSGSVEVTRGIRPTGVNTGIALQVLHEAASQRNTGPAASWTFVKQQLGQGIVELMQEHYSDDRVLAIVDGTEAQAVGLSADDLSTTVDTGETIPGEDMAPDGSPIPVPQMKVQRRKYLVTTREGGELPMSPAARAEMALQLKQIPSSRIQPTVIDDQAALEATNFPGRDKVTQRAMAEMEAELSGQQAALQQQQQQQSMAALAMQAEQLAAELQTLLPPEMMTLLREIMSGTVADEQLVAEFIVAVKNEYREAYAPLLQLLAIVDEMENAGGAPQAPAPSQPMQMM